MRIERREPPREFAVGRRGGTLRHVADVALDDDELVTFVADSGSRYDVTRKSWGYYATPSLNQRAAEHGLRGALCVGVPRADGGPERIYLMLVERGREDDFEAYVAAEEMRVLCWLDTDAAVRDAARALASVPPPHD